MRLKNLCDQQPQLPVAQHGDRCASRDTSLFQNFAGGGQRFHEHGLLVRDVLRDDVEISFGQSQELPKCTRVLHNPQHGAIRAVPPQGSTAPVAVPTGQIDLADNSSPDKFGPICFHYLANELMTRRAGENP